MNLLRTLDAGSLVVILLTFALFVAALWVKGIGHDLLLEGGVFLVSVKLILMAYKNGVSSQALESRLDSMAAALGRIEERLPASGAGPPSPGAR